jgi:hypothetical protein
MKECTKANRIGLSDIFILFSSACSRYKFLVILSPCFIKLIPRTTNNFHLHMQFALDAQKIAKHKAKNERLLQKLLKEKY